MRAYSTQTHLEATFKVLPKFTTNSSNVKVLFEPREFYSCLLQRIKHARRRLFFSSLYLGKEEQAVIDALHDALSKNPQLTFHYIADYLRSTREAPSTCSASLLAPLKSAFPDRVHLGFWHTPELNGLTKTLVPHRFNEGWGLWHAKIYGADDDVIFSGANLSKDYFTNRQDRYISFSQPDFADYAQAVIQVGQAMSYQLQSTDGSSFDLTWNTDSKGHLPEPTGPRVLEYKAQAREMWRDLQAHWASRPREKTTASEDDVEIRPFLQMGSFGVREETDLVVPYLLGMGSKQGVKTLDLTSGYFSLDSTNQMRVLETPAEDINVICASPQANGFYQSRGVSKYIPPAYTLAERRFWRAVKGRNLQDRVSLREWSRDGWTYHAKGIWLNTADGNPFATVIGSSNYGPRSASRDTEVNALVMTSNRGLQEQLRAEITNLREHTQVVTDETFTLPGRRVGWGVKIAAWLIKDML